MNLLKISLSSSLIGISLLLILSNILTPNQISIKQINNRYLNKNIIIKGQISDIKSYPESDFQIIQIKDNTGKVNITINKITNLKKFENISVIGSVIDYKDSLQIQSNKIIQNI